MKKIIQIHILFLSLFLVDILMGIITGYTFKPGVILAICIGYYVSVIACFVRIKSIDKALKEKAKTGIAYVISLSVILFVELMAICISALYIFVVAIFSLNAPVKAKGAGYEIRSQGSMMWPRRYVLYKNNLIVEKQVGDIHANEEDFEISGRINAVMIDSVVNVTVNDMGADTVLRFEK